MFAVNNFVFILNKFSC